MRLATDDSFSSASDSPLTPHNLLLQARLGDQSQLGNLLNTYRNYLSVLADQQLDQKLRGRIGPSDIVQETMLEAYRDFGQFRGGHEREFTAWLRRILANTLARIIERHVLTKKRDIRRDVSLKRIAASVEQSAASLQFDFVGRMETPSCDAQRRERAVFLADAIAKLPPRQREVLIQRNMRGLKFREIAERQGGSVAATKMLWMRAIKRLRELCEGRDVG